MIALSLRKATPSNIALVLKGYWSAYHACRRQWHAKELEEYQTKNLRAIIKHAYEHVEFYKKQLDSVGIKPHDIKTWEDLPKLPTLSKQDLRMHFHDLIANNIKLEECGISKSSGSTGEPTTLLKDKNVGAYEHAAIIRQQLACGIKFGERFLFVSPDPWRPPILNYCTGFQRVWLFPKRKNLDHLSLLRNLRPTVIYGAPSYMRALARKVQGHELGNHLKAIISSYELLDKWTRQYISDAFDAEVFDNYGSSEGGSIAWECSEHIGYHINTDNVIVEILKGSEPVNEGERGEIVVTYLHNQAMPLIRYKIGDVGTFTNELCPCGRKLPLMGSVKGRTVDFIVGSDGGVVSPHILMGIIEESTMFESTFPISLFQIIQENKNLVVIKIVRDIGVTPKVRDYIERGFNYVLGEEMKIRVESVDSISYEKSGKFKTVISKVPRPNLFSSAV